MEHVSLVVSQVIKGLENKIHNKDFIFEEAVKNILTKKELKHIKFRCFKKETAYFQVDSAVSKYSLNLKKDKILDLLKTQNPLVKKISFRLGVR